MISMGKHTFYRFIDDRHIEKAPIPLSVSGQDVFTNSEKVYNSNGYYRLVETEYPQDGSLYVVVYELKENTIYKNWQKTETSNEEKIAELKQQLAETDYQAIKYAEGWLSEEEYEPIKTQRQAWREEINNLELEQESEVGRCL